MLSQYIVLVRSKPVSQLYWKHLRDADSDSKWAKELNHAVAYFIVKGMQPYYTVEKERFKKMLNTFDPKYSLEKLYTLLKSKSLTCSVK